jgi:hypothetical protein
MGNSFRLNLFPAHQTPISAYTGKEARKPSHITIGKIKFRKNKASRVFPDAARFIFNYSPKQQRVWV